MTHKRCFISFLLVIISANAFSVEQISDSQRILFFDTLIPSPSCPLPASQKITIIKNIEKCLVIDSDKSVGSVGSKSLIVKLSCKPDEVRSLVLNAVTDFCKPSPKVNPTVQGGGSQSLARSQDVSMRSSSQSSDSSASVVASKPAVRRPLVRPGVSSRSEPTRQVVYTDLPSGSSPTAVAGGSRAVSTDSTRSNQPTPNIRPISTSGVVAAPSSGGGRAVIGGCGTPEQCDAYMAEAAKPKYSWRSPVPFMNGPIDKLNHMSSEDGHAYEQPTGACGASNQGELIAVDYGSETVVVACMGAATTTNEQIMEKIKKADISKLPKVVAVKKELYSWECIKKPDPLPKDSIRICDGVGRPCEKLILGNTFSGGPGCGSVKCVRSDGGGLATDPKKPKKKGPCDE